MSVTKIPSITRVRYHRSDLIIEVRHIFGFTGENHFKTLPEMT